MYYLRTTSIYGGDQLVVMIFKLLLYFRLTGLDPANPPFFPAILLDHLSHSDAEFVDIIHTDAGLYGQPYSTGTVDFWPNSGNVDLLKSIELSYVFEC